MPGDRPDRFDKALASGADEIIIDLEDAVSEASKAEARRAAATWLAANPDAPAWVRVNNRPDLVDLDLDAVAPVATLGVVMPKADLESCAGRDLPILALIESARGVLELDAMARLGTVARFAVGEADLAADLGLDPSPDGREFWSIRSQVVTVSAAFGLRAPTGPVHTDLDDDAGLRSTSEVLRRQGFGTRSAIHPAQIPIIAEVFAPATAEVARAEAVIAAYEVSGNDDVGVAVVDGVFVDAAVVRQARNVIRRAR